MTLGAPVVLFAALLEVMAPVWVDGDPLTLGPWGAAYGGFAGIFVGLVLALVTLLGLLGGDLDSGSIAERLRHGQRPVTVAMAQGCAAVAIGLAGWAATGVSTAVAAAADGVVRTLVGVPAAPVDPPHYVNLGAALGPIFIAVGTAMLWLLLVATRSGVRAAVVVAVIVGSFFLMLVQLPTWGKHLVELHPLAPAWRALGATRMGEHLPGALHGPPVASLIVAAAWATLLVLAAHRGLGRLGKDR